MDIPSGGTVYNVRPQFVGFHNRLERFAVGVAHRRAGKTVACISDLIKGAVTCELERPRFAYLAPLRTQAKDVAWNYLKHYGTAVPGSEAFEYELRVDFPNGGRVRLYGADNPDALRGLYLDGVVLDEYAQMRPGLWSEVIRPALSDRKGWAVFIGTPMGRNAFYELMYGSPDGSWAGAVNDPEWFTFTLKASETGLVDTPELESARKSMTEDQYAQEYECSFDAAVIGAYYGVTMRQLEEQGHIGKLPYEPRLQVTTAWDLGIGDSTAIWFIQQNANELRVIDYYESSGVGLDHYAKVLAEKPYAYREHLLPHDAEVKELGTGRSRVETLRSLGVVPRVLPAQSVEDGINAVRTLLPTCWFDEEKCARGIEALRQYRREYDDKLKAFKQRPLHDWTSHAADAFRYLAMGLRPVASKYEAIKYPKKGIV